MRARNQRRSLKPSRSKAGARRPRARSPVLSAAGKRSGTTPIERLGAICLALPEATKKLAWGEPTWCVKGRLFAQLDDHHHGADHLAVWVPVPLGEQEAMICLWGEERGSASDKGLYLTSPTLIQARSDGGRTCPSTAPTRSRPAHRSPRS